MLTEGRLILEFTFDDLMRIRMWHFAAQQHCELIPRGIIASLQVTNAFKSFQHFTHILVILTFSLSQYSFQCFDAVGLQSASSGLSNTIPAPAMCSEIGKLTDWCNGQAA